MFATSKTLLSAPASKEKKPKEIGAIRGLQALLAITHVIQSLDALKTAIETDVKDQMMSRFLTKGCASKKRPANFEGVEGTASASCELRIRSSASPLTTDEITLLMNNAIGTRTIEASPETFVINPAYKDDLAMLERIENALRKVKGIPSDLFIKQQGVSKTVVDKEALDVVFGKPKKLAGKLLPVVSVMAVKPKFGGEGEMTKEEAYEIVQSYMNGGALDDVHP